MKNIIASGCSFTDDGIGGVPPTESSSGGSTFVNDLNFNNPTPKSWASFVTNELQPISFVNTASGSHGNQLISTTIVELLSQYNYNNNDTLVIFNISNFFRQDFLCRHDHSDASFRTPWSKDLLDFNFINIQSNTYKNLVDLVNLKQTMTQSKFFVKNLFEFLDNNNFQFFYLWMEDYSEIFYNDKFLKKYLDNKIDCGSHNNMLDFCISKNLTVSTNDHHPSVKGHKIISEFVLSKL